MMVKSTEPPRNFLNSLYEHLIEDLNKSLLFLNKQTSFEFYKRNYQCTAFLNKESIIEVNFIMCRLLRTANPVSFLSA